MADIQVVLTGDDANLFKAYEKLEKKQKDLEQKLKDIKAASKDASEAAKKGADDTTDAAGKIGSKFKEQAGQIAGLKDSVTSSFDPAVIGAFTGAVGGIAVAVRAAGEAWRQYREDQGKALASLESQADVDRRLVQVSTSSADLEGLQKRADDAAQKFGVERAAAKEVLFSSRSEGFESEFEKVIRAAPVVDPKAAAIVAGKLPALFQGKIKPTEAVSLTLAAAEASNLNFEQLASTTPQAAEGGAIAKASPQELLAVQSVLASRFKSGETAADRIKAFATAGGIDERFKGKGIIQAFKEIQALSDDDRKEFLGKSAELNTAYVVLSQEMGKIEERLQLLTQERESFATGGGALEAKLNIAQTNPAIQARKDVARARNKEEIAREENLAQAAASLEVAQANTRTAIETGKFGIVERATTRAISSTGIVEDQAIAAGASSERAGQATALVGKAAGGQVSNILSLANPISAAIAQVRIFSDFVGARKKIVEGQPEGTIVAPNTPGQAPTNAQLRVDTPTQPTTPLSTTASQNLDQAAIKLNENIDRFATAVGKMEKSVTDTANAEDKRKAAIARSGKQATASTAGRP